MTQHRLQIAQVLGEASLGELGQSRAFCRKNRAGKQDLERDGEDTL